jgi:hypothetical protein
VFIDIAAPIAMHSATARRSCSWTALGEPAVAPFVFVGDRRHHRRDQHRVHSGTGCGAREWRPQAREAIRASIALGGRPSLSRDSFIASVGLPFFVPPCGCSTNGRSQPELLAILFEPAEGITVIGDRRITKSRSSSAIDCATWSNLIVALSARSVALRPRPHKAPCPSALAHRSCRRASTLQPMRRTSAC